MKIGAFIEGDLAEALRKEGANADIAVSAGVSRATTDLKNAYRAQVVGAGLGRRLSNTWRGDVYQPGTVKAAGFIHNKAASIISAYAEGVTITAHRGMFLAIPTKLAKQMRSGRRRITPAAWAKKGKGKLRFVPLRNGNALLVAPALERGGPEQVIFVLVRQATVRKRFDVDRPAEDARASLPQLILESWPQVGEAA